MIILLIMIIITLIYIGTLFIIFTINKGKVKFIIDDNLGELDFNNNYPEIGETKKIVELKEIYRSIILYKIFPTFFEIITINKTNLNQNDFEKDYNEFEIEYNKIKNYNDNNNKLIKKIFKETGRIAYRNFSYDFNYICKVNNKCINIMRIANYINIQGDGSIDSGRCN